MSGWVELHENEYGRPMYVRASDVSGVVDCVPNPMAVIYAPGFPYGKSVRESAAEVRRLLDEAAAE